MAYFINIYVGTPPQRQSVIVDTGSYLTAFPCAGCKENCGHHTDEQFSIQKSQTSEIYKCTDTYENYECQMCDESSQICIWKQFYAEGSQLNGYLVSDNIVLGDEIFKYIQTGNQQQIKFLKYLNHEKFRATFGCTNYETNMFVSQIPDGIMGLSPNTNSRTALPNIVDELFKQHKNNQEKLAFSLCLGNNGGFMSLGGYNHELHIPGEKPHIVDYNGSNNMYSIKMFGAKVGSKNLTYYSYDFQNPMIDSGTTLMFASSSLILKLYEEIQNQCKEEGKCQGLLKTFGGSGFTQYCYQHDPKKFPDINDFYRTFPSISFYLQGDFEYIWTPDNYFFVDPYHPNNENLYCFAFEPYGVDKMYLGGSWMKQYDILFDRQNSQIHFTKSNCAKAQVPENQIENDSDIPTTEDDEFYISTQVNDPNYLQDIKDQKSKKFYKQVFGKMAIIIAGLFIFAVALIIFYLCIRKFRQTRNQSTEEIQPPIILPEQSEIDIN